MKLLIGLAGLLAVLALYVRLAPSPTARWHRSVHTLSPPPLGSYTAKLQGVDFTQLHDLILQTKRTKILAGSPQAQHVTYITRTALWGFPDYTTVEQTGSEITIVGRLRFGRKDFGVNKARIRGWVDALAQSRGQAAVGLLAPHRVVEGHFATGREHAPVDL